jgi:translocator protein
MDIFFSGAALALVTLLAGASASLESMQSGQWYSRLNKPRWTPPDIIFGPVWSGLYVLMLIAAWLVWRGRDNTDVSLALSLYLLHLILHILWPWLFFVRKRIDAAFFELILLQISEGVLILLFARINRLAALLLIPYAVWTLFALLLNYTIWKMNPDAENRTDA